MTAFFTNDFHNFPDTNQSEWTRFATTTSQLIQKILHLDDFEVSLNELLQVLAEERLRFAQQQPDLTQEKIDKFGQWRVGTYDCTSRQLLTATERRKTLNRSLKKAGYPTITRSVNTTICHTLYGHKQPLFASVLKNLKLCEEKKSSQLTILSEVDSASREAISQLAKMKIDIYPTSFYDDVVYKKYTLTDQDLITEPLTSFYITSKPMSNFFALIEHPPAHFVSELLATKINELFLFLIRTKNKPILFVKKLGEFIWYCNQLMPFERGSASIFLILTSALLQFAGIPLNHYPDGRLDIDAMSLTKEIFTQKFIAVFSDNQENNDFI